MPTLHHPNIDILNALLHVCFSRNNVLDMFELWTDSPDPSGIRGPSICQTVSRMDWLVGWLVGELACPIMPWITPSSPRQLLNCYPPFCGAKPECVELAGRGAHWNPLAWGVFSLLCPKCWQGHNFTHIHTHIHTKCQLRGSIER